MAVWRAIAQNCEKKGEKEREKRRGGKSYEDGFRNWSQWAFATRMLYGSAPNALAIERKMPVYVTPSLGKT